MKYRQFIEDNFLIDEPKTGKLVPFRFNQVQSKYYEELVAMGIEEKGIALPLREFIVKARREGFSSLILAIFAADDILQTNPTETMVVSYRDDATSVFRKRYRRFILSFYAIQSGMPLEQLQNNSNQLELFAKSAFTIDGSSIELAHNRNHFYCGTAAGRTGGRGGVVQKLLFSEAAHYQDTEKMTAKEIIEGTAQQVDKEAGWIFQESTANGKGNYFYQTYETIKRGLSRYLLRFYGWRSFYSEEQFKVIASEFTDPDMLRQEYPENEEEAFLSAQLAFTNSQELLNLVNCNADKQLEIHLQMNGVNYIDQCEMIRDFLLSYERANPNRQLYIGIDSAKDVDKTIVTVLKRKELSTAGGVRGIAIDATGAGDFMPDWFERNSKWYVLRVKFSRPTKSIMYKNLRVVIQDRRTSLPLFLVGKEFTSEEWETFYREMLDLQKKIVGDMLVVEHPPGENYHDDYPDSWVLAEYVYMTLLGVPMGQRPPEETTHFNSAVRRLLDSRLTAHDSDAGVDNFV
jgi:hypothetical protein